MLAPPRLDAAAAAANTTLLNCYLREGGTATFTDERVSFPALGLRADVTHRSLTLHHRFANVDLEPVELARRIATALDPGEPADALLARVEASLACVRSYLDVRDVEPLWTTGPLRFIDTEQALVLGHPLHPTPKGLSGRLAAYAPELQPRFQLHWLRVDPERIVHESAVGDELFGAFLLPAHPWEAGYLARAVPHLFEDLGPSGDEVTPTSSVRTVYREDWPYMLKFSLHARVTNSMRVTLPKELRRAVEAKRLSEYIQPEGLTVWHDVAYLSVPEHDGFSVLFRENRTDGDISSLTTLCQDHPYSGRSRASLLAEGRGREWYAAYLDVLIVPLIRAYLDLGLTYEPHQQNTLLELRDGMPVRGIVRDSQGYFHREAAHKDICVILPAHGEASESIFPEALADERLVYYPFVNNALGVIDALRDVVDERTLLEDLKAVLERERSAGGRYPATLLDRLLDDERWPCKANLRTRLHDLDELVGDISTQSVYVTIPNPLRGVIELVAADPDAHLSLVHGWMNEPHVAEWWNLALSADEVRAYLGDLGHLQPWIALSDGVPFAYVETYRVAEDPLAEHYRFAPDDRGWHVLVGDPDYLGTGASRELGRMIVERLLEEGERVVCEPDVRNARMLAYCHALGGEVRAELELPDKRAALVVWER